MKLNWGFGIFAFYTAFVIFILFLVFRSTQEQVDLVTDDYYQKELEYQDIIKKKDNATKLDTGLTYTINKMSVDLQFPPSHKKPNGNIIVYRPSNKNFDKSFDLDLDENNEMSISMKDSPLGLYKMMVSWEFDSLGYYVEKDIYLTP